jgi:signal transduction histidine kinase
MSSPYTRLARLERAIQVEAVISSIRHDLRNKFANVRNAVFYIRRRHEQSQSNEDPRVGEFLRLIDSELTAADQILSGALGHTMEEDARPVDLCACGSEAVRLASPPSSVTVENRLQPTANLKGSADGVTLLIRGLIDNAVESMPDGGHLLLSTASTLEGVTLTVAHSRKSGRGDMEMSFIQRVARYCHARVVVSPFAQWIRTDVIFS